MSTYNNNEYENGITMSLIYMESRKL